MPSDDTRRLLRTFGVAVTTFEDAVAGKATVNEVAEAEAGVRTRLAEVSALIERLREEAAALAKQSG